MDRSNPAFKPAGVADTMETQILDKIVREGWESRLKAEGGTHNAEALESHAANMRHMLRSVDYEVLSMPHVIANTRNMTRSELKAYLCFVENLAHGYKILFDNDLASIIIAGITLKAKDLHSIRRHFNNFIKRLEERKSGYLLKLNSESGSIDDLVLELRYHESSFLKFLRKKNILKVKRKIKAKNLKVKNLKTRAGKYDLLVEELKRNVSPYLAKQ